MTALLFNESIKREERENIMIMLLSAGANVNAKNKSGTVLHNAAFWGREAEVELLIAAGIDVEVADRQGRKALQTAFDHADVKRLFKINKKKWNNDPTFKVVLSVVKKLIVAGADFSSLNGNPIIIRALIDLKMNKLL